MSSANAQVTVVANSYTSPEEDGPKQYYRIPVILRDKDGNLMAIYDDRHNDILDLGNNHQIDIVAKISTDNGRTFGSEKIIVPGNGQHGFNCGHGDAAAVCDRETGDILILSASGDVRFQNSKASATKDGNNYNLNLGSAMRIGKTVIKYPYTNYTNNTCTDISEYIYGLYANDIYRSVTWTDAGHLSGIRGMYVSTGRLCQSKMIKKGTHYRVYAVLNTRGDLGNPGPRVIYSDNFGETWAPLGDKDTHCSGGDETQVEELPDGSVLLSSRVRDGKGRKFNVFTYTDVPNYTTGSWESGKISGSSNSSGETYAASCNSSFIIANAIRKNDGAMVQIMLQTACMSGERKNLGIYWKELSSTFPYKPDQFTKGWNKYDLYPEKEEFSCYSSMVQSKEDGSIALLYESEGDNTATTAGPYDILLQTISLEKITGNLYQTQSYYHGMEPRVMLLKSVMAGDRNETRYIYNDGMNMKTVVSTSADKPSTPDYNYYWVLNRDPGSSTYYFSALSGDGYIGLGNAINLKTGVEEEGKMICTTKYAEQFNIASFTKKLSYYHSLTNQKEGKDLTGYGLLFYLNQESQNRARVISISNKEGDDPNFLQETETCWKGSNNVYWTTDFHFNDAEFKNITSASEETCGTWGAPEYYGFKVKFGRTDDSYTLAPGEDRNYYATIKLPYAIKLHDDVTAYRLSFVSSEIDGEATLEPMQLEDNILPRETPALLMIEHDGTDSEVTKTRYFQPAAAKLFDKSQNSFRGTLGAWTFKKTTGTTDLEKNEYNPNDKKIYILGRKNGHMAFYYLTANSEGAYSIGNNKAYFVQPDASATSKKFSIHRMDNAATGIENITPTAPIKTDNTVYDLTGRKMSDSTKKGVYIRNGKKFIVK